MRLSSRVAKINPSETLAITAKANALRAQGRDVIGFAAGPEEIVAAINKIQSQNTSNPTSISQKAAVEALSGDQGVVEIKWWANSKSEGFLLLLTLLTKFPA